MTRDIIVNVQLVILDMNVKFISKSVHHPHNMFATMVQSVNRIIKVVIVIQSM